MYKFKVGDTVRFKYNMYEEYVIAEITPCGWHRKCVGDQTNSYRAGSLELVCPAGYRPVRKDEMGQSPAKGDAYIYDGVLKVLARNIAIPFWRYGQITFYRPVEQKLEWGWCDISIGKGCTGLTEQEAKSAAEKFSKEHSVETFVYKVVGKFAVKTETKVEWNDA